MPLDHVEQTDDEENGTHESILSASGARPIPLRSENGRVLKDNPGMFYTRLRSKLRSVGVDFDDLDYRTEREPSRAGEYDRPPCFALNRADYAEWLRMAAISDPVPIRLDLPGEPNYCNDCTPAFKAEATKRGACLFPNTRFEVRRENGEKETVGVSRSHTVPPEEYVVYQQMTVPLSSLDERIRSYVRARRVRELQRKEMPKWMQDEFDKMDVQKTEPA